MREDDLKQIISEIADEIYNAPSNQKLIGKSLKSAAIMNCTELLIAKVLIELKLVK